jgi:chromosome segregation protein
MYLKSISISGFKSFARPTELRFGAELTAIVGPNGAGKSNILDAVRWCLGEQSMKAIRGKKSVDVLFAGSSGRGRANVAEVEMVLDNSDHLVPLDFAEISITRRLHRDGESEYLLAGKPARLADITLLLAQANFGQKSYSIVSQGMVDHVVAATPSAALTGHFLISGFEP